MKTKVGSRKARAVSPRPRRLNTVSTANSARHRGTVAPESEGKAEVSEAIPAAMETATVKV